MIINDRNKLLEAVREDGFALGYASEELRGDKEVVLEAVRTSRKCIKICK